jgi:NodT family efflux transporter outer membrane factor (OMF) lipoprotein
MPRWNSLPVIALAGALAGCTTVGPNFERPAAPAAETYAMAGDAPPAQARLIPEARAAGPWWTTFGSAELDRVMGEALAGNQTVAAADAALERALAGVDSARGGLAPQVDANAGARRERFNTAAFGFAGFPSPTINLYSVGGTVAYDLDLWGGTRRKIEAAAARAEGEGRRADAAYLSLTGNVAIQAARIAALRAEIATVEAIVADDQRNIDIVLKAEAAGGEAPAATIGGRSQLAQDEALLPPLRQQLAEARHALALLVGRSPAEWSAPDFDLAGLAAPAEIPVSLPSALVRRRPDILAAEADLHAATADIGVATADLYPNISLSAALTQTALTPGKLFSYDASGWSIGAGLTAPIFHGGSLKADKRAAEAAARESLAKYRQTVLEAFVQVSDVMAALSHDDEAIRALAAAQSAAQAHLDQTRAAYSLGGGAFLPVVDAQRALNRTRRDLVQAQGRRLTDVIKLYAATAADWRQAPKA